MSAPSLYPPQNSRSGKRGPSFRNRMLVCNQGCTPALFFELHIAVLRGGNKSMLQLIIDAVLYICEQRVELLFKVVVLICLSDKPKYSQAVLFQSDSKTTAELLQEDRQGFHRSEEQDGVNLQNIHTFVINIDNEN